jgi:putative transposase
VKLTIGLKLTPNAAQAQTLEKTLRLANAAANECSRIAWDAQVLAGVEVITIDARNTSRECSMCGHIEKLNRRSQKRFQCRQCDYKSNADLNAARVIASRGAFNRPNAGASATRNLLL